MRQQYFKPNPGDPEPISVATKRVVRFEEVDQMRIVWHGRYASYFEDARVALGDSVGLGYMDYYKNGVMTPIRKLHADYHAPLFYGEEFTVEALMRWTEAARINMEFSIRNSRGELATTGYSVQMMLNLSGEVLLAPPPFHVEVMRRWREGEFHR